jgi:hypothetical protein
MKGAVFVMGIALLTQAAPALACLPPPPGAVEPPPPTEAEQADTIFRTSTNIVYGVVTGEVDGAYRFKIIHSYKGALRPDQTVLASRGAYGGWGFDPPHCFGMIPPPPLMPGAYGVVAFQDEPQLNFVGDKRLAIMFDAGWIRRASQR